MTENDSPPFAVGSVPVEVALPVMMEMLIKLQGSVDAMARMLCETRVSAIIDKQPVEVTAEDQEKFVNDSYQNYRASARKEMLNYGFALRERFPLLEANDANK
jgi:hypothetical protein